MPEGFRAAAKAVVATLIPLVGILVAVGLLDVEVAAKITVELIAYSAVLGGATGAGVYVTRNR